MIDVEQWWPSGLSTHRQVVLIPTRNKHESNSQSQKLAHRRRTVHVYIKKTYNQETSDATEIFTSVVVSSIFSLYSTALLGRLVGLEPTLTVSILPRCITMALALSIVSFFEGTNPSLTTAVVVVTGLIGANFVQTILDKLQFRDPIACGIATTSSAHGLGTAALLAKELEALPFCTIAYALTGIFGSHLLGSSSTAKRACNSRLKSNSFLLLLDDMVEPILTVHQSSCAVTEIKKD